MPEHSKTIDNLAGFNDCVKSALEGLQDFSTISQGVTTATANKSEVSGQAALWGLVTLALSAMTGPSLLASYLYPDSSELSMMPYRSSPIFSLLDALSETLYLYACIPSDQASKAPSSHTRQHPAHATSHSPVAFTLKLVVLVIGVLPQAIKLFGMTGIPITQTCAAMFLASIALGIVGSVISRDGSSRTESLVKGLRLRGWSDMDLQKGRLTLCWLMRLLMLLHVVICCVLWDMIADAIALPNSEALNKAADYLHWIGYCGLLVFLLIYMVGSISGKQSVIWRGPLPPAVWFYPIFAALTLPDGWVGISKRSGLRRSASNLHRCSRKTQACVSEPHAALVKMDNSLRNCGVPGLSLFSDCGIPELSILPEIKTRYDESQRSIQEGTRLYEEGQMLLHSLGEPVITSITNAAQRICFVGGVVAYASFAVAHLLLLGSSAVMEHFSRRVPTVISQIRLPFDAEVLQLPQYQFITSTVTFDVFVPRDLPMQHEHLHDDDEANDSENDGDDGFEVLSYYSLPYLARSVLPSFLRDTKRSLRAIWTGDDAEAITNSAISEVSSERSRGAIELDDLGIVESDGLTKVEAHGVVYRKPDATMGTNKASKDAGQKETGLVHRRDTRSDLKTYANSIWLKRPQSTTISGAGRCTKNKATGNVCTSSSTVQASNASGAESDAGYVASSSSNSDTESAASPYVMSGALPDPASNTEHAERHGLSGIANHTVSRITNIAAADARSPTIARRLYRFLRRLGMDVGLLLLLLLFMASSTCFFILNPILPLYWAWKKVSTLPKGTLWLTFGIFNLATCAAYYLFAFNGHGTSNPGWTGVFG